MEKPTEEYEEKLEEGIPGEKTSEAEERISEEFRELGKNLIGMLRSAWESPERKKLQQEIENGIMELGITLKQEAETFRESPTGQRLKSDMEDVREKLRTRKTRARMREEVLSALRTINSELEKVADRWREDEEEDTGTSSPVTSAGEGVQAGKIHSGAHVDSEVADREAEG